MANTITKKRKGAPEVTEAAKRTRVTRSQDAKPEKTAASPVAAKSATKEKAVTKPATTKPTNASSKATTTDAKAASKPASKKAKKAKKEDAQPAVENDDFAGFGSDSETEAPASKDHTALLAGFSSDSETEDAGGELPAAITEIPALPTSTDLQKELKTAATDPDSLPGVIYIGRIPRGFYEPQMKAYFSQFGTITRLRLSRNKLTGRPKHYGFVEFESGAVADIVAKTMDKYLMFGHILQVRRLKDEEVHAELWKGAGRRFKAMPRNKVERGLLERGTGREGWEKRVKKEEKRRKGKESKLKELGFEFEMPAVEVKAVASVPQKVITEATEVEKVLIGDDVAAEAVEAVVEAVAEAVVDAPLVADGVAEVKDVSVVGTKRAKGRKEKKVTKKARVTT